MYVKPNNQPLSPTTGYLYPIYLQMVKAMKELNQARRFMERTKPWFDK